MSTIGAARLWIAPGTKSSAAPGAAVRNPVTPLQDRDENFAVEIAVAPVFPAPLRAGAARHAVTPRDRCCRREA
jgi:hypothetical protein